LWYPEVRQQDVFVPAARFEEAQKADDEHYEAGSPDRKRAQPVRPCAPAAAERYKEPDSDPEV
jgi:hypothetical protein